VKSLKKLAVVAFGALLTACTPSLHPLFTEKDVVFESALLGKWVCEDDEGSKTEWSFTRSGDKVYGLVHVEDGDPGRFEARMVKLGQHFFLDLYPEEPVVDNGFYKLHLVRAHTFAKITLDGDALSVSIMDPEWLEKSLDDGDLTLRHEKEKGGGILLTAPTAELQQFVLKAVENPEAFPDASTFRRYE
jgi:hypothetical protein